ncbi:MAG: hypothetical protein ACU843_12830 [Gammaproteobacteria bacterium]
MKIENDPTLICVAAFLFLCLAASAIAGALYSGLFLVMSLYVSARERLKSIVRA